MDLGWLISTIVAFVLGAIFVLLIGTMNKKVVRDKKGNIDFSKSDIYFYWTRWDYTIIVAAIYTFLCISGLLLFLLRRSEEHTSELQSRFDIVCRLLLEKNNKSA